MDEVKADAIENPTGCWDFEFPQKGTLLQGLRGSLKIVVNHDLHGYGDRGDEGK